MESIIIRREIKNIQNILNLLVERIGSNQDNTDKKKQCEFKDAISDESKIKNNDSFKNDLNEAEKEINEIKEQISKLNNDSVPINSKLKPNPIDFENQLDIEAELYKKLRSSKIVKILNQSEETKQNIEELIMLKLKQKQEIEGNIRKERNNDFESSSDSEEDEKVDDQITHITFAMLEDMYFKEEQNQEDKEQNNEKASSTTGEKIPLSKSKSADFKQSQFSLSEHKEMREHMTDRMMGSAFEMKQIARQFGNTIKEDTKVLEEIENKQDKNIEKTKKDDEQMKKINTKVNVGFWMRIFTLFFSMILFWFLFFVIRLFPLKIYPS